MLNLGSLSDFAEHHRSAASASELLELTRARCVFEVGEAGIGQRFDDARREALTQGTNRDALVAELRKASKGTTAPGLSSVDDMPGGLGDIERTARLLQLTRAGDSSDDPVSPAPYPSVCACPTGAGQCRRAGGDADADARHHRAGCDPARRARADRGGERLRPGRAANRRRTVRRGRFALCEHVGGQRLPSRHCWRAPCRRSGHRASGAR